MQEEIKTLKKQLREANAKNKTLEEKNLKLLNEIEVLRADKGYVADPNEMSEEMLKAEMTRFMLAYQKFPTERRRLETEKRQEVLDILTPMIDKAMSLEKEEKSIPEAIKAHEACLKFAQEHKEELRLSDYEKSCMRIAVLYRKMNQSDKEVAFIQRILNTRKKYKQSLYSEKLYHELEHRLKRVEEMLARKK
ncbi:hypothetical protein D0T51_12245 [Parabacteroides sp. 52]|uniref:hypothetical protein n=1 Tax=unclassified Parabacteroides TaxID=2649774 RepID=UPI0013D76748|nr:MULTISPECIES: hypothetical protein [unclassified Parabacteroides]MDH6534063.1 hypothetical protein [Parabacteroides sp. PM5-20]NDV56488.1 hypothetical protein [Parabacteroides sp. 52]